MKRVVLVAMVAMMGSITLAAGTVLDSGYGSIGYVNTAGVGYIYDFDATMNITDSAQFAYGGNYACGAGDIDGDGLYDFWRGGSSNSWYEQSASGGYSWKASGMTGGSIANGITMGDFDNDGFTDVIYIKTDNQMRWYEGNGTDTGLGWRTNWPAISGPVTIGDFDGDSKPDLLYAEGTNLKWREASGDNVAGYVGQFGYSNIKDMVVGDFDGDAYGDLFIVRNDGSLTWWENDGDNSLGVVAMANIVTNGLSVELGDVDGDGLNELFVGRSGSGIKIFKSTGDNAIDAGFDTMSGSNANDLMIFPATIPEPCTLGLLAVGAIGLLRRKK